MGDIEYWYKTYSDRVTNYEGKVDGMGTVHAGDDIEDQVAACAKVEKKAEKDKRALGMEARLIKDADMKSQWEEKIQQLDDRLATAKRALATKKEQAELFGSGGAQSGAGGGGMPGHIGPTNDEYLDKTEEVHDKIDSSLANTLNLVNESEEVGAATLEALAAQRTQIEGIHGTVLNIEDALNRSDALLRQFGKRMATDRMIQFFFMLNVLGLIGIIIYSVLQNQGLNGDDAAPADDATPSGDDYRSQASGSSGSTTSGRRLLASLVGGASSFLRGSGGGPSGTAGALVQRVHESLEGVAGVAAKHHAASHFLLRHGGH